MKAYTVLALCLLAVIIQSALTDAKKPSQGGPGGPGNSGQAHENQGNRGNSANAPGHNKDENSSKPPHPQKPGNQGNGRECPVKGQRMINGSCACANGGQVDPVKNRCVPPKGGSSGSSSDPVGPTDP